jgi:hypothetical protein
LTGEADAKQRQAGSDERNDREGNSITSPSPAGPPARLLDQRLPVITMLRASRRFDRHRSS